MKQRLASMIRSDAPAFHVKLSPVTKETERTCGVCKRSRHISLFRTKGREYHFVRTCELCRSGKKRPRKVKLSSSEKTPWEKRACLMGLAGFQRRRVKSMWSAARTRAWRYAVDFTLSEHWVAERIAAGTCEVTGLPFEIAVIGKSRFAPSIDRRNPSEGYTPENCQMVVWAYNMAKGVGTHEEVLHMATALVERSRSVTEPASAQDSHLS